LNWLLPKKAASEKTLEEKNKAKQKQDGKIYQ
jgi:uracil permease